MRTSEHSPSMFFRYVMAQFIQVCRRMQTFKWPLIYLCSDHLCIYSRHKTTCKCVKLTRWNSLGRLWGELQSKKKQLETPDVLIEAYWQTPRIHCLALTSPNKTLNCRSFKSPESINSLFTCSQSKGKRSSTSRTLLKATVHVPWICWL